MTKPAFLITIDTEGDHIWDHPERITTENARFLPRFQRLCEEHGFKPTYLVNYEMAIDPRFQELGRAALREKTGEIGLHVHPWNSPPVPGGRADDAGGDHVYMYEVPDELLHAKVAFLTNLLADTFESAPRSHRAGRWGFDEKVAHVVAEHGYLTDCSVTPGVSWKKHKGASDGDGGPDFYGFPEEPYFLDLDDIRKPGASPLLEVPMTIRSNYRRAVRKVHRAFHGGRIGRAIRSLWGKPVTWLRPNGKNLDEMRAVTDWAVDRGAPALEFMLHSSEFMPGGSPTFDTAEKIEVLYDHLKRLFSHIALRGVSGRTLSEFRTAWDGGGC
jgi:hypothetical protein